MEIVLEKYLDMLLPWNCKVLVGGRSYKIRPLLLADLAVMEAFDSVGEMKLATLKQFVEGLFESDKPDLDRLPAEAMTMILAGVMGHWSEQAKKNGASVRDATLQSPEAPSASRRA